jgi:hypothetical protein
METCDTCGNSYDKTFQVIKDGKEFTFDSFECALHSLAPNCKQCGCRILGHGVEVDESLFCCAHCARKANGGKTDVQDRA